MGLKENLIRVQQRIASSAQKSNRTASDIKLVCVSKQRSVEQIKQLQSLGQMDFGENRLQELVEKAPQIKGVNWHFVGSLQSSKVRKVVELCDFIHSVDSLKLFRKINFAANDIDKTQNVFLEVNVSGEKSKHGIKPSELVSIVDTIKQLPFANIRVLGLMTMAPLVQAEKTRPVFRNLFELAQSLHLKELSMGMTNDFEVAIEEGATVVRVGTAVFGE